MEYRTHLHVQCDTLSASKSSGTRREGRTRELRRQLVSRAKLKITRQRRGQIHGVGCLPTGDGQIRHKRHVIVDRAHNSTAITLQRRVFDLQGVMNSYNKLKKVNTRTRKMLLNVLAPHYPSSSSSSPPPTYIHSPDKTATPYLLAEEKTRGTKLTH